MVSVYDESITQPPYLTIQIGNFDVEQPTEDYYGEIFAQTLRKKCSAMGRTFKFYSMSEDGNYDYEVVVY